MGEETRLGVAGRSGHDRSRVRDDIFRCPAHPASLANPKTRPPMLAPPRIPRCNLSTISSFTWQDCGSGNLCAPLTVPVDYANPTGPTIKIALLQDPATGNSPRGPLVINPGGPGGSGVDYANRPNSAVTPALHRSFDIIGFDPRGVSRSEPVECLTDAGVRCFHR